MQNTKKIAIFALSTLVLAGGGYVFRDSALFDGLSSSVLNQSFTCTQSNLQSESASYRQTKIRYKKALVLQKDLEREITHMIFTMSGEVQKKQDALKILKREMATYTRFIKRYDTCKREVSLYPSVSPGIMSGEVKIIPSLQNSYQELVGFEIASPENLDTFLNTLQFHVRITPIQSLIIDQWFLISDTSAQSPCQSSQSGDITTIDCDMLGGIPASILSTTKNTYKLGANIVSVDRTVEGRIEILVEGMTFNDGREGFENKTTPSILQYGVVPVIPPVVPPPEVIVPTENLITTPPVTLPPVITPIIPEIPPVVVPPEPDVSVSDTLPPVVLPPEPNVSHSDTSVSDTLPPVVETSTPPTDGTLLPPPTNELPSDTDDTETPSVPPEVPPVSEQNTSSIDVVAE